MSERTDWESLHVGDRIMLRGTEWRIDSIARPPGVLIFTMSTQEGAQFVGTPPPGTPFVMTFEARAEAMSVASTILGAVEVKTLRDALYEHLETWVNGDIEASPSTLELTDQILSIIERHKGSN